MKSSHSDQEKQPPARQGEQGNILLIILIAIVLIGALTAAISGSSTENATIDDEQMAIKVSEVRRYAAELERAMNYIQQNPGLSEEDIRFMNPDPSITTYGDISADSNMQRQVFDVAGGGANYREPPSGIQNSAASWEFYGTSNMPGVGTDKADLIAVLPDVTLQFCTALNKVVGQTTQIPTDTGTCLNTGASGRFGMVGGSSEYDTTPNDLMTDVATFTKTPAMQACVQCDDNSYHFYYVLKAR